MHMRKLFRMYVALALMLLGVTSVYAAERIPFDAEHFTFYNHDGWDADATVTTSMTGAFKFGEADGCPIGDTSCNAWVDLNGYSKMYVKMEGCDADGNPNGTNPRIFINRLVTEGQFNADKAAAKCLVIPNDGTWAADYYTRDDEGTLVINLSKIAKDFGFVHFHSIKGSAWNTKAIVHSLEVEKAPATAKVGWTSIINNGSFEEADMSSFVLALNANEGDGNATYPAEVADGAGVDGSGGLLVSSMAGAPQTWSTQLFVKLNEAVTEGTKWRFSMDVKSDKEARVTSGCHAAPRSWIAGGIIPEFTTNSEWQTITAEGEISKDLADKAFGSIAFDLNNDKVNANTFYFDNIKFEVYKYGTIAEQQNGIIKMDFGFDTNIADLVKQSGKKRLVYPEGCAKVTVDGEAVDVYSVEAYADGRFYIFTLSGAGEESEVKVSFTNPADPAYQIVYTSAAVAGQVVKDVVDLDVVYSEGVITEDVYPYDMEKPTLVSADPENGSFNLPNSIKEFKVSFDKNAQADKMVATLNGEALTITPNEGVATDFVLTRSGDADLPTGEYTINITKVYPENDMMGDDFYTDTTYTFNVGKVELDPTDVEETVMTDDFAASGATWLTSIDEPNPKPDGWAGGMDVANRGGGSRIVHNQAGFVKDALYLCQRSAPQGGIALYGVMDDAKLPLQAKNYHLFLSAGYWDQASTLKVQVLPEAAVNADDGSIIDESQILVEQSKLIGVSFKNTTKSIDFDVVIPVTVAGNYVIRLVAGGTNGQPGGWTDGSAIGNVKVQYLPNTAGAEWIRLLDKALENAKADQAKFAGERYAGAAQTALDEAIAKYEAEKENYTSPSAYQSAADDLNKLAAALTDHGTLCNNYDEAIKKAIDVVRQTSAETETVDGKEVPNAKKKFMKTELFTQLTALVDKYHGTSEWVDVADHTDEDPENPVAAQWQLNYSYDVLTDDAALTAAVAELKDIANTTSRLFTVGESKTGSTGVMAQVERLRRGAETLKSLGVADDDALVVAANDAVTDDDNLAETIKQNITKIIYEQLKTPGNTFFEEKIDETTFESVTPKYEMSVFFKNPNIYALQQNKGFSAENVPGWEVPTNNGNISIMWTGGPYNIPGVAEDCVFTQYHATTRMEQTVTDLPAGVYTIVFDAVEWSNEFTPKDTDTPEQIDQKAINKENGFVYVKLSDTPAPEEGLEEDRATNFAATLTLEHVDGGHRDNVIENIVVTDGILTAGVNFGPDAQYEFDQIKALYLTAPASVDYASLYDDVMTGIETLETQPAAKVRAIELYTLDGRRIATAQKGIVIVKKYMNDGTVRTEKVIRK